MSKNPSSRNELIGTFGKALRSRFPFFAKDESRSHYLDTAASSQKLATVIDRLTQYLSFEHANIHRGAYRLSGDATLAYDRSREKIAGFLNAKSPRSVVFTKGTTESVNLAAHGCADFFKEGDSILLSLLEHHSNIVPWQLLAERKKLRIVWADILSDGSLNIDDFKNKLRAHQPKLVAITQLSNALGTLVPAQEIIALAHAESALVFLDAAQGIQHLRTDVRALDVDLLAFSGHKCYGPTGIGVLYGKEELLERMKPFQGGGDMIEVVTTEGSTWAEIPSKFEAGTPPIAEAIALYEAIEFLEMIDWSALHRYEDALLAKTHEALRAEGGIEIYGPITQGKAQASILSFNVHGVHPHDLSTIVDNFDVQIRAGHHCAQPLLRRLGIQASARLSFGVYSTFEDVEALLEGIRQAKRMFG